MWTRARWLLKAGPSDYMLAMSVASASLPVIGKHLEPLGAATAMGIWGYRHMPDFLGATARSWFEPGNAELRQQERDATNAVTEAALRGIVAAKDLAIEWPAPESTPPLWKFRQHRRSVHRTSVRYGDLPSQLLDVWRRKDLPAEPAPVLIFVPGGAWVHGSRMLQGYALMSHLAEHGLGLPVDRLPRGATPPLARTHHRRQNRHRVGARQRRQVRRRPQFRCGSGLFGRWTPVRAGRADRQRPGVPGELPEGADTSVDAVVGIYGRYDWEDRSTPERDRFVDFLERVVVEAQAIARTPTCSATRRRSRVCTEMRRRSWSFTAARTASSRSSRRAASSSGCVPCRIRWSAIWSCLAPVTAST